MWIGHTEEVGRSERQGVRSRKKGPSQQKGDEGQGKREGQSGHGAADLRKYRRDFAGFGVGGRSVLAMAVCCLTRNASTLERGCAAGPFLLGESCPSRLPEQIATRRMRNRSKAPGTQHLTHLLSE